MPAFITENSQFFTASIKGWYKLLEHDKYKDIVINSLRFLVDDKRIKLFAFVIMTDHIHLIWQMQPLIHPQHVQIDFLKYTAQHHPGILIEGMNFENGLKEKLLSANAENWLGINR